ncbi:methylated-DNA-[protein]-cysteine S-methyltransferase [Candidatus Kryptonium thompsonii]|uniref:Methylated-DNA--protein-cysteine methyltransferase n=1 Tax=Candidatus Kryptonium thompsonii TaxID=1633631 RepID=A0A0P1MCG9_9BACT|nr:methylated-DNA--[protein]-cysteine S-methyltransferase [Candidatus Kryptonium thompsoni]CUS80564.1 methylated-DNA-[protein]-cysteine S-methyltransferase [Candidatus Kryptonium thompsoni]CUS81299.1 methylated-DNA-[protein]-cysteine S-methyltransferase [Candidatus Kryptonium thompsoni]CUS81834.1 methylated-DNA-[protein]-cysteine S-methyltransferase [Candidatus Kryptonium thompsoni]CUS85218.1 methylated-DNA-[protein]-cysteine S-methyltransferase [Candidatus Kryptonium thompsoni]CUS86679.1 meth
MLYCTSFETIIGVIYVASSENGVCKISLTLESADEFRSWIKKHFDEHEVVENRLKNKDVIEQIKLYLARKLKKFELPIDLIGTDFQKKVWRETMKIPYGNTITYSALARRIHKPNSYRAVANALGANPLPIIVPCHRVIASDGSLGGYTGGVKIKEFLLGLEGARGV